MGCTNWCSDRVQRVVSRVFRKVGYNAYVHPCKFILGGVLLTILCSIGLVRFNMENEGVRLWVPSDSEIISNYNEVVDKFGEFETTCILLITNKDDEDMVTSDKLDALYEVFEYVTYNLTADYKSKIWNYDELCLRDYPSYPICEANEANMFALWGNNPNLWESDTNIDNAISTAGGQALAEFLLGDLVYDETTDLIINGKYFRILWGLASTTNDTIYEANRKFMTEFQDYFEDFDSDTWDDLGLKFSYFTSRSFSDEIGRVVTADTAIYIATFVVMFVFLALTLGDFTCLGARAWLATITMTCMVMALAAGYGLGCAVGIDMNSVVLLIPYILIGVGVDDEILIIEAVDRTPYIDGNLLKGADRFADALEHCGLSISLTTFCSVMAFIVGTNVTMPGVSGFCAFAAFCFWVNYILQFLIFLPILALDEQRKNAKRNFCCWCIKHDDFEVDDGMTNGDKNGKNSDDDRHIAIKIITNINVPGLMEYIVIPVLRKRLYRLLLVAFFVIIFIVSIISLQWLSVESDSSRLVPDDSYAIDYLDDINGAFGSSALTTIDIVLRNLDFSSNETRNNIYSLITEIEEYDSSKTDSNAIGTVDNWLIPFGEYIEDISNGSMSIYEFDEGSSDMFYQLLQSFANTTEYAEWANEIIYNDNDNPSEIRATRFYIDFSLPVALREQWPLRLDLKDIIGDIVGKGKGYGFQKAWPFAYFEFSIVELTVRNIGSASSGVLFVLCIMMDVKMAIFIIIVVVMIDIELFGWMVLCDVSLDSITFLQLVMAVGLTVDYCVHITHALAEAESKNDDFTEKIEIAMREMGVGVVKGAFTTFLGVFSLAFSSSVAFRGFFTVFAGIILVAVANGLFFVPGLMAEMPFLYKTEGGHGHGHSGGSHVSTESGTVSHLPKDNNAPADIKRPSTDTTGATDGAGATDGTGVEMAQKNDE